MKKKPWIIILVAFCFLLSPIFIILQVSVMTNIPVIGPHNIFLRLSPYDIFILFLYLVCAVSIYFVKKWGWYVFIISSICLITGNTVVFMLRPQYLLFGVIIYNLVLTITAGIFFHHQIISPYFHPRIRWWEQATRYVIGIFLEIEISGNRIRADILDISTSGVFIVSHSELPSNPILSVTVHAMEHRIDLFASLVRKTVHENGTGYGLMFVKLDDVGKTALHALMNDLNRARLENKERSHSKFPQRAQIPAQRFMVDTHSAIVVEKNHNPATLINLSRTGCLLHANPNSEGSYQNEFNLSFSCLSYKTTVHCKPRWFGVVDGENVCGCVFVFENRQQKQVIKKLSVKCLKGHIPMKINKPFEAKILLEFALLTPYRYVNSLKKMFTK